MGIICCKNIENNEPSVRELSIRKNQAGIDDKKWFVLSPDGFKEIPPPYIISQKTIETPF